MGKEPIFTEKNIRNKYMRIFNSSDTKYTLVRMPMNINAMELYNFIKKNFF